VVLKIITVDASKDDCFEFILMRKDLDFEQDGGKYIALPSDHFWIEGPNGKHLCLVLPVLGPRIPAIWTAFPDADRISRDIAHQVTMGLQFVHWNGIFHGGK